MPQQSRPVGKWTLSRSQPLRDWADVKGSGAIAHLASKAGVTPSTASRWVNNRQPPESWNLIAISAATDGAVSVLELVAWSRWLRAKIVRDRRRHTRKRKRRTTALAA